MQKYLIPYRKEILLFIVISFCSFVVLELSAIGIYSRVSKIHTENDIDAVDRNYNSRTVGYVLHPYLGFVRDYNKARRTGECNKFGFRGDELTDGVCGDTITIGIFGGSVAGKFYVFAKTWLKDRLQQHKNFKNKKIRLACIALGGFKQPQQLLALTYFFSLGIKFDIIINIDGFNEIALPFSENVPADIACSFPRSWNLYCRQSLDIKTNLQLMKIEQIKAERIRLRHLFTKSLFKYSHFMKLIWKRLDDRKVNQLRIEYIKLQQMLNDSSFDYKVSGPLRKYGNEQEIFLESAVIWARSSKAMSDLCAANNIAYFHFLQPNQYYKGSRILTADEKKAAFAGKDYKYRHAVENGYGFLVEAGSDLKKQNVNFYDLTMIFKDEKESIYIDKCCHVNELGNRILTDRIAEVVISYLNK